MTTAVVLVWITACVADWSDQAWTGRIKCVREIIRPIEVMLCSSGHQCEHAVLAEVDVFNWQALSEFIIVVNDCEVACVSHT